MSGDIQNSYDTVAREYADEIYGELANKPFDREVLNRFADRAQGRGPVCDLGCGPGQIARYLRADYAPRAAIRLRKALGQKVAAPSAQTPELF